MANPKEPSKKPNTKPVKKIEDAVVVKETKKPRNTRPPAVKKPPVKKDDPKTETPKADEKKKSGVLPVLIGGIVAGGIGFGAATYYFINQPHVDPAMIAKLAAALDVQKTQLTEAEAKIAALSNSNTDDLTVAIAELRDADGQVSGMIDDKLAGVSETIAAIEARLTTVEKRPISEGTGVTSEAAAAYERELEAMRAQIEEQRAAVEKATAEAEAKIKSAEEKAASLESSADSKAKAATVRTAMSQIQTAIESGTPFGAALKELGSATDVEIPAALADNAAKGVATLADLQKSFDDPARAGLAVSIKATTGDGAMDKLGAFLRTQVGARSIEAREGDDPDAVLSRAGAAVKTGDLAGAIALVGKLPDAGQHELADWVAGAQARIDVVSGIAAVSQALNSN